MGTLKVRFTAAGTGHGGRSGFYQAMDEGIRGGLKFDGLFGLEREKENVHDANAIKIVATGRNSPDEFEEVGYVPATLAQGLAILMDRGVQVKVEIIHVISNDKKTWWSAEFDAEMDEEHDELRTRTVLEEYAAPDKRWHFVEEV